MVFTTLPFIIFMAAVIIPYYLLPRRWQWAVLLAASYVFYAWASPPYLIFLGVTTAITYCGAVLIERHREKGRILLAAIVTALLLMLGIFKYAAFICRTANSLLGAIGIRAGLSIPRLLLPVGLSFYLFQSIGYCIDVYWEKVPAERNFLRHALFVSFFPQLLQGPIGDYGRLAPQLFAGHTFSYRSAVFGLQRAAWGFFKKLVIANQIALVIDGVWAGYGAYPGFLFWAFVLCLYSFQLYADFSGYMDIALGCAQMLGITLDENFAEPYFSRSIAEFWRRWHITLGTWFKNYVFYPLLRTRTLAGIRKTFRKRRPYLANALPTVIALLTVWLLIGLWHGADWCYVLYGVYHGTFIIASTLLAPVYAALHARLSALGRSRAYALFQTARTFALVTFGYVLFRPADLSVTAGILRQMACGSGLSTLLHFGSPNFKELSAACIGLCVLAAVDMYHMRPERSSLRGKIASLPTACRWSIYVLFLLAILVLGAYGRSDLDQFAYFRF